MMKMSCQNNGAEMKGLKTCENCRKFYTGDGYNGVCTNDCWALFEYRKNHNMKPPRQAAIHKKEVRTRTLRINEKWLQRDLEKINSLPK